jgi:hypothetical protein
MTSALEKGWVVSTMPRLLYRWVRPGTHCTGGWVGPRAGLDVCEKSRPTGIRYPDHPAHSQSLYQLSYPAPISVPSNFYLYFGYNITELYSCAPVSTGNTFPDLLQLSETMVNSK